MLRVKTIASQDSKFLTLLPEMLQGNINVVRSFESFTTWTVEHSSSHNNRNSNNCIHVIRLSKHVSILSGKESSPRIIGRRGSVGFALCR